jgi:hypothetical protein
LSTCAVSHVGNVLVNTQRSDGVYWIQLVYHDGHRDVTRQITRKWEKDGVFIEVLGVDELDRFDPSAICVGKVVWDKISTCKRMIRE